MKQDRAFIILTILIGLLIRLDFLIAGNFVIDADEAIVGLMARHIVEGQPIPVFYYGQHYMGSFEPLLTSVVFALSGPSLVGLKAVPLIFSLLLIVLVYQLGFELNGKHAARFGALIAALPPATLVVWSTKARGGFIELVCIGALALLLTVRTLKKDEPAPLMIGCIGLVLGFGWWVNNQIIFFMLPIGAAFLLRFMTAQYGMLRNVLRTGSALLVGSCAFIVGGLPYWLYNVRNDFVSFEMFGRSSGADFFGQVSGLFTEALPIILGARRFWQIRDVFPGASICIWLLSVLGLLAAIYFRRVELRSGGDRLFAGVELLLLFIVATLAVFAISSFGYLSQAPRYLLPLYAAILPLMGFVLSRLYEKSKRIALVLCCAVIGLHLASCYYGSRALPGEPFVYKGQRVSKDHTGLIRWLDQRQIRWVKTNYWIGYRLAFESDERIKFLIFQKPHQERIKSYRAEAEQHSTAEMPYVLVPSQAALVKHALQALGYTFKAAQVSGYTVIHSIEPLYDDLEVLQLAPESIEANYRSEAAREAIDGKRSTRWGSGRPQGADMRVDLRLDGKTTVRAIRYDLGQWIHDYPRGLKIEVSEPEASPRTLLNEDDFKAIRYLIEYDPYWTMHFEPIVPEKISLLQVNAHPVFDWSIAELTVYR